MTFQWQAFTFILFCLLFCLSGCASKHADGAPSDPAPKTPLTDLDQLRKRIPDVLESAGEDPYATPANPTCRTLGDEIGWLNRALGPDLDGQVPDDGSTLVGADRESAPKAERDLATAMIPDRGWMQRLTSAERHSKEVTGTIRAGAVRRAFLKGLGQNMRCAFPASPLVPISAGTWRFTHALPAPWAPENPLGPDLRGATLAITQNSLAGPEYLSCEKAAFTRLSQPAAGLFEGGLPAPAEKSAATLGLAHFPVATTRVACPEQGFDLHQLDASTLLLGLDNRVWNLSLTEGTKAANTKTDKPEMLVQLLLEAHFAGDMGFSPEVVNTKIRFFSDHLKRSITRYFAVDRPTDEVPPINGDPFTDSQEYPTRFLVGSATGDEDRSAVPVLLADAWKSWTLIYVVTRESGMWKLQDIFYPSGVTVLHLLSTP